MLFIRILDRYYYTKDGRVSNQGNKPMENLDKLYRNPEEGEMLVPDHVRYSTQYAIWSLYNENKTENHLKPCNIQPNHISILDNTWSYIMAANYIIEATITQIADNAMKQKLKQYSAMACRVNYIMSDRLVLTNNPELDGYLSVILDLLMVFYKVEDKEKSEEEIIKLSNEIASLIIYFYNERSSNKVMRLYGINRMELYSPDEEFSPTMVEITKPEGMWDWESVKLRYLESKASSSSEKPKKGNKPKIRKPKEENKTR